MQKTVAFITLGCKVNQYDTEAMRELFVQAGYRPAEFEDCCDVYVINTCCVTGTGENKSLQAVRRAQRRNPDAAVVVCGCLAQRDGPRLLARTGARLVLGTARRGEVVTLLEKALAENTALCAVEDVRRVPFEGLNVTCREGFTRAVMKIQEGCSNFCTYCVIPYVRGGTRSRSLQDIAAEAERLGQAGYREIVLTGIHLTSYGRERQDGTTLLDAVRAVHGAPGVERIRLGSLEPVIATDAFAQALAALPKVCPQFHLALQSGSDTVLHRMRRHYDTEAFRLSAQALRQAFPGCALTTDVMSGFPGETEQEHADSLAFCRQMGFSRMHVFPYSERQGTVAASMPGAVPVETRRNRAAQLIALGKQMAHQYCAAQVGSHREVLFETCRDGVSEGYSREYIRVSAPGDWAGQTRTVRITAARGSCLIAADAEPAGAE